MHCPLFALVQIISYDAQGIHYYSSSIEGSYRDKTVVNMLSQHNAKYRG